MIPSKATETSTVLLVHGAWAGPSSWAKVLPLLEEAGVRAAAVQLPLTSVADDVAAVADRIAAEAGRVILVGHSYGGVVITQAGVDPRVEALVYIAAFAPDVGESANALLALAPPSRLSTGLRLDGKGHIALTREGVFEAFAQDLTPSEKAALFNEQAPTSAALLDTAVTAAAWRERPTQFLVATNDQAIPQMLQRRMAHRMDAAKTFVASSHVPMLSHQAAIAESILPLMWGSDDRTQAHPTPFQHRRRSRRS